MTKEYQEIVNNHECYILWDAKTNFFYMEPGEPLFFVYSAPENCVALSKDCTLKRFCYPKSELKTFLYNNGFTIGFFDGKTTQIKKDEVSHYARNSNHLCYLQYKLTGDEMWLEKMEKDKLFTFCKLNGEEVELATIANTQTGEIFVMTFTDKDLIPQEALDKYQDFTIIRYPFKDAILVNMDIPIHLCPKREE